MRASTSQSHPSCSQAVASSLHVGSVIQRHRPVHAGRCRFRSKGSNLFEQAPSKLSSAHEKTPTRRLGLAGVRLIDSVRIAGAVDGGQAIRGGGGVCAVCAGRKVADWRLLKLSAVDCRADGYPRPAVLAPVASVVLPSFCCWFIGPRRSGSRRLLSRLSVDGVPLGNARIGRWLRIRRG